MKNRMIYQMKNKVRNLTYFLLLIGGTALTQSCSYLDVVSIYQKNQDCHKREKDF